MTTEREKIKTIMDKLNFPAFNDWGHELMEQFYHAAQKDAFEQAASLSVDWGNARKDNHGGNACRNLADAIRQLGKEK